MEIEPKPPTDNVAYIDEYPELAKRVWLRRLDAQRNLGIVANHLTVILPFPGPPDGAA